MEIVRPKYLDEALAALAENGSGLRPIAGGTDIFAHWPRQRDRKNMRFLDLSPLHGALGGMALTDDELILSALTTYWNVAANEEVSAAFPLLREAALEVGAIQIQTRGTWAGNIANASPAADGVPTLMAYDAELELRSTQGSRRVRLDEFYTGYKETVLRPDELIVRIRMPFRVRSFEWRHKVGTRAAQSIAKAGLAVVRDAAGTRVAASSAAPYILRCKNVEAAIEEGRAFASPEEIAEILNQDISPIDDIRSTAKYRRTVLARLLYHALRKN